MQKGKIFTDICVAFEDSMIRLLFFSMPEVIFILRMFMMKQLSTVLLSQSFIHSRNRTRNFRAGQLAATKVLMDRGAYSTIDEDRGYT